MNQISKGDQYPLPNISDVLDYLNGSRYFSSLDLKSGYYQVEVAEEDQEKTAFCTPDGLWEFKVMPFGLKGAPATFQRTMDVLLSGLKYNICLCYLDDILVFSPDFESHLSRLTQEFHRIRIANLKFNPNKCLFALQEVTFLGFKVTHEGQLPAEEKVRAVRDIPVPKTVKQVRGFVGLASFYRKFVEDFAKIAAP